MMVREEECSRLCCGNGRTTARVILRATCDAGRVASSSFSFQKSDVNFIIYPSPKEFASAVQWWGHRRRSQEKKTKERILVKNSGVLLAMGRWPKRGELWFLKASLPAAQQVTSREVMQPHWQMKSEAARRGSHWRGNTKKKNKILSLSSRSVPTRPVPLTHT